MTKRTKGVPLVEAVTYLFMAVEAGGALALSIMCVVVTSTFLSSYLMTGCILQSSRSASGATKSRLKLANRAFDGSMKSLTPSGA